MSDYSILIVDDDRSNCLQVSKFLHDAGYHTDYALDGAGALEIITRNPYTLVILDYQMPGMDGVELYRRIRHVQPATIGIFLTAFTTIDTVFPAISMGIERVLAKPVNRDELLDLVEDLIGHPDPSAA